MSRGPSSSCGGPTKLPSFRRWARRTPRSHPFLKERSRVGSTARTHAAKASLALFAGALKLAALQLGFDRFGDFLVVDEALCFFHDFAVAGDEEAGGIAEQPAELVGYGVIAPQDGVIHRELLTVYVEAFFGGEGGHHVIAFVVHVDAKNREALGGIF